MASVIKLHLLRLSGIKEVKYLRALLDDDDPTVDVRGTRASIMNALGEIQEAFEKEEKHEENKS